MPPMHEGVREMLDTLALERVGDDVFAPTHYPRRDSGYIFGGQLLAQTVRAAAFTLEPDRLLHSVHAHFLLAGRPSEDLTFAVERTRDGGSFSTRRVEIRHGDTAFYAATLSFNRARPPVPDQRPTADYQRPAPTAPHPEEHEGWHPDMAKAEGYFQAFDLLEFPVPARDPDGVQPFNRRFWFRMREGWPTDPLWSTVAYAFASDMGMTIAASVTEGLYPDAKVITSLDHALWIHRPVDATRWTLLDMVADSNYASRGFVRGGFTTLDGVRVASSAQENLIR